MSKARDFNYFFGEAQERNRIAGDILRKQHAEQPFCSRQEIHEAFARELERLQPEFLTSELVQLSEQFRALLDVGKRRGFRIDGRRTENAELAAEMSELGRATEAWLAAETEPPLTFSLQLIEKYRRELPMLADAINLPERVDDAPKESMQESTLRTSVTN